MEDTFWLDEQVAPQSADPLFQLMLERGEVDEDADTEDLRLGVRQQAMLTAWIEHSHEVEESVECSDDALTEATQRKIERAARVYKRSINAGLLTELDAIEKMQRLGCDPSEAWLLIKGE